MANLRISTDKNDISVWLKSSSFQLSYGNMTTGLLTFTLPLFGKRNPKF